MTDEEKQAKKEYQKNYYQKLKVYKDELLAGKIWRSRYTHNVCYNSNYRGIKTDYKCVSLTYNSLLFSVIFGLHLSIISL